MAQKFASIYPTKFANEAVGWSPGGPFDPIGPYAKVNNCPVHGTGLRLTCYATGIADTFFSIPAHTRYRGMYVGGFFTQQDGSVVFHVAAKHRHLFPQLETEVKV